MEDGDGEQRRHGIRGLLLEERARGAELSRYLFNLPAPNAEDPAMVARTLRRLVEAAVATYQDTIDVLLAAMAADDLREHQIRRAERATSQLQEAAVSGGALASSLRQEASRLEAWTIRAEAAAERLERALERLEELEAARDAIEGRR